MPNHDKDSIVYIDILLRCKKAILCPLDATNSIDTHSEAKGLLIETKRKQYQ